MPITDSPTIAYGNTTGQYFTQWRFDELAGLARELHRTLPAASGWSIWYDGVNDFHRLELDADGHHYTVSYYKVFTVSRDGDESYDGEFAKKNFGRYISSVERLFQSGRHIDWAPE